MKTFKDFCLEAYSRAERESHKIKPTGRKKYNLKFAPIDLNYRKYNMPTAPRGNFVPPKTLDV